MSEALTSRKPKVIDLGSGRGTGSSLPAGRAILEDQEGGSVEQRRGECDSEDSDTNSEKKRKGLRENRVN